MHTTVITPSIGVTIGRQMRLFHAFVTTAPAVLDAPSTVTLYLATLSDISAWPRNHPHFTACVRTHRRGWCSSTPPSSIGSERAIAKSTTCLRRQIPCSSG